MIGGTVRPNPAASLSAEEHLCPRCGIQYRDTSRRWLTVAPCRDCRPWYGSAELDPFRTAFGLNRPSQTGVHKPMTPEQQRRKNELARRRRREAREDAA